MVYNPRELRTNLTRIVLYDDIANDGELYNAVFSYSSIEHDGLGCYCDPIDPEGDRHAIQDFWQWLRPNGLLFLGVPVGDHSVVRGTDQRIIDKARFESITHGFDLLAMMCGSPGPVPCDEVWNPTGSDAAQPWFVLRKRGAEEVE